MSSSLIRVADAPLLDAQSRRRAASAPRDAAAGAFATSVALTRFYSGLLILTLLTFFSLFMWSRGISLRILILLHYLLWPMILIGVAIHISRSGTQHLGRTLSIMVPFLAIGIFSGLFGFNPIISARMLTFWTFGMLAAAAIGGELPPETVRKVLFWSFAAMLVASVGIVMLKPSLGVVIENRGFGGHAWRGIFIHKNHFGAACAAAVAVTILASTVRWRFRAALLALAAVCLVFSTSEGAVVSAAAVVGFIFAVGILRRSSLSPGMQALLLGVGAAVAIVVLVFGSSMVLELLGRDPTLTGRSTIWAAFLQRAMYFWLTGAGPGSFSDSSPITYDLTLQFHSLGLVDTPHNKYIAVFGEVGIVGFVIFLVTMGYLAFVLPLTNRLPSALPTAAITFVMLVGGLVETRQVYGINAEMVLAILMFSSLRREEKQAQAAPADLYGANNPPEREVQDEAIPFGPRVLG